MSETRATTQAELLRDIATTLESALLLMDDCRKALAEQSGVLGRLEARPALDEKTLARRISEAWAGEMLPLPDPPKVQMPWGWVTVILALAFLLGVVLGQGLNVVSHGHVPTTSQAAPKKAK